MKPINRSQQQLGMEWRTAGHHLHRIILFDLLQRHNEDSCFKCGKKIESIEELSIEHIKPWRDRDPALYWDSNNIAFSHRKCNRPHRWGALKLRKVGPPGTAWCSNCQAFLDEEKFAKHTQRWNGLSTYCKSCAAVYRKKRNHK